MSSAMICIIQVLGIVLIIGCITTFYVKSFYRILDKEFEAWKKERTDNFNKINKIKERWRKEGRWNY